MAVEQAVAPSAVSTGLDPVTLEIIHGALEAAIREMEALVDRTSMSAMIKEKKDRFVGMGHEVPLRMTGLLVDL